jgi:transcriptional regulator with XRE-family HTH domain
MGELIDIRREPVPAERLWREALGEQVREVRRDRGQTLTQTSDRAGISPQYLSEVERGLKDPSSEIVAAIAGALDLTVLELTSLVVGTLQASADLTSAAVPVPQGSIRGPVALAGSWALAA